MSIESLVQIAGSLLILVPFVLVQLRRMRTDTTTYAALNLVGSAVLAVDALHGHQWGFLLLEGTWAAVSAYALVRRAPAVAALVPTSVGRGGRPWSDEDRVMDRLQIELPAGTIHYRESGPADGRPVVFVHGFLVDDTLWSDVPERLAKRGLPHVRADLAAGLAHDRHEDRAPTCRRAGWRAWSRASSRPWTCMT